MAFLEQAPQSTVNRPMRLVSWNVNGIRSILKKGFLNWLSDTNAEIVCLQETKIPERELDEHVPPFNGYTSYWHSAERDGYSGVAVLTKYSPTSVQRGINSPLDHEGRVLTLEFETLYIVNVYVPNSQTGYIRLPLRLAWDEALRAHVTALQETKTVIVCGDFNVAYTEKDVGITDAKDFPGCSSQERESFQQLLSLGFIDSFRHLHPDERQYSWWAYTNEARSWNQGVRFDYHLVSTSLAPHICSATTHRDVLGSDHGPIGLELEYSVGDANTCEVASLPSGQYQLL